MFANLSWSTVKLWQKWLFKYKHRLFFFCIYSKFSCTFVCELTKVFAVEEQKHRYWSPYSHTWSVPYFIPYICRFCPRTFLQYKMEHFRQLHDKKQCLSSIYTTVIHITVIRTFPNLALRVKSSCPWSNIGNGDAVMEHQWCSSRSITLVA